MARKNRTTESFDEFQETSQMPDDDGVESREAMDNAIVIHAPDVPKIQASTYCIVMKYTPTTIAMLHEYLRICHLEKHIEKTLEEWDEMLKEMLERTT